MQVKLESLEGTVMLVSAEEVAASLQVKVIVKSTKMTVFNKRKLTGVLVRDSS